MAAFRKVVGATNPLQAEPGTIRGDLARVIGRNIVHASDSPSAGVKESSASSRVPLSQAVTLAIPSPRRFLAPRDDPRGTEAKYGLRHEFCF